MGGTDQTHTHAERWLAEQTAARTTCVVLQSVSLSYPLQLRREKAQLEQTLEQEQEQQISKLTKKIGRLEKDVLGKQSTLEKV